MISKYNSLVFLKLGYYQVLFSVYNGDWIHTNRFEVCYSIH